MAIRQKLASVSVLGLCVIVSACGTTPVREDIPSGFQSGTEILGVVTRLYSRDEVVQNKRPLLTADLKKDLLAGGIPETDIQDGSEMEVVTYCYAWNSKVGCKNIRGYMAHASPDLRDQIQVNSVVAVKLDINKENRLVGSVVRVYGEFEDPALSCEFIYMNYIARCNQQFTEQIVGGACQNARGRTQQTFGWSSTSEQKRRLCGPGIFRVAPEKEFFNRIGQFLPFRIAAEVSGKRPSRAVINLARCPCRGITRAVMLAPASLRVVMRI
jgi:hypothetical protein